MKLILPENRIEARAVEAVLSEGGNLFFRKGWEWWVFNPHLREIKKSHARAKEILALTGATPLYSGDHVTLEI